MSIDLGPAATRTAALLDAVTDEDLGRPTPCPDYTVGDLLDHIGGLALAFSAAATKTASGDSQPPPAGDATNLTADWRTRIAADLTALAAAWRSPDAWTGMTSAGGLDMPGEIAGLVALDEVIVHGWDLARAIGAPYEVSDDEVAGVSQFLASFPPEARGDAFGMPVDTGDGASALDRAIALSGRDPGWSSAR